MTLVFLGSSDAWAFSLSDHRQITEAAFRGIQSCLPSPISDQDARTIQEANLWEDINVLKKWFGYSHFYHPESPSAPLHAEELGFRKDSRARVVLAQALLEKGEPERSHKLHLIGALVHHLQDMAVPPHVLPVNHFWTDGFEKLKVTLPPRPAFESCEELIQVAMSSDPTALHHETANETLHEVLEGHLSGITTHRDGRQPEVTQIPLTWFWEEGVGSSFGRYGALGNAFGMTQLTGRDRKILIESTEYARYKSHRLHMALRVTQIILARYWFSGLLEAVR